MGLDISIKLNIEIASEELRNKFYIWSNEYASDEIGCLSRDFCNMVLSQHSDSGEPIISELSKVLSFDCKFLQEPKVNHIEEDEDTRYQFGWVNSISYLNNLKIVKTLVQSNSDMSSKIDLSEDWKYYFSGQDKYSFQQDIDHLIEVLEIGNLQGLTEICYSVG